MLEVKIFSSGKQRELEDQLNQFFSNNDLHEKVKDVKFSSSISVNSDGVLFEIFTAMVILEKSNRI